MQKPSLSERFSTGLQYTVALGFLFCGAGCGTQEAAPVPNTSALTVSDPQLSLDLKSAMAGGIGDRCATLEQMGEYWSQKGVIPGGFSDLPVETPQPDPQPIPEGDIEAIATVLQAAITDSYHDVREAAAIALSRAPQPSAAVNAAIAVALNSEDSTVLWYLWQLEPAKFPFPEPGPYVENLIRHLKSDDFNSSYAATVLIGRFGNRFAPYTVNVVDALGEIGDDEQCRVLLTLADTGLSEEAAHKLPRRVRNDTADVKAAAFVALMSFPDRATRFLRNNSGMGAALAEYDAHWFEILYSTSSEQQELRAALIATPDLGPLNLALIGAPDSIPELTRELAVADQHRQTLLRACIRACGGDLGEIVHLSADIPVAFRPESAWPEVDHRRQSGAAGHGDGITEILVTGELRFANDGHPAKVHFLRTNDSMLLGESLEAPMPLKYDAVTGRFVLRTSIFAAFDMGEPQEPGPYQTRSAQVRIESPDSVPLFVQFFDETPHVVIELQRQ